MAYGVRFFHEDYRKNNMLSLPLCDISKDKIYVFYSDHPKTQPFFPPLEIFSEPSSSYYIIYFL